MAQIDYKKLLRSDAPRATSASTKIDYKKLLPSAEKKISVNNLITPKAEKKISLDQLAKKQPTAPAPANPKERIVTLSEQSGGGQYKVSAPGVLLKTNRSQDALPLIKGYERDHKVPVSLGGVSSKENLQQLPDKFNILTSIKNIFKKKENEQPRYEDRQMGKVAVEAQTARDYNNGKISLPEARLKIITKNQEIHGLIPEQGVKAAIKKNVTSDLGQRIKEAVIQPIKDGVKTTGNFIKTAAKSAAAEPGKIFSLKDVGSGIKEIDSQMKSIERSLPRAVASTVLNVTNKDQYTPKGKIAKTILGTEPIQSSFKETTDTQKGIQDFLQNKGMGKKSAITASLLAAPAFVGSMKAMDLTPLGSPEKGAIESAAKNIAKSTSKEVIEASLKDVLVNTSDKKIGRMASRLVHVSDPIEVKNIISETANIAALNSSSVKSSAARYAKISRLNNEGAIARELKTFVPAGEKEINIMAKRLSGVQKFSEVKSIIEDSIPSQKSLSKLIKPSTSPEIKQMVENSKPLESSLLNEVNKAGIESPEASNIKVSIENLLAKKNAPKLTKDALIEKLKNGAKSLNPVEMKEGLSKWLNPIKHQDSEVQSIFKDWNVKRITGHEKANVQVASLPKEGENGLRSILHYEQGLPTENGKKIQKAFDDIYQEAADRGLTFTRTDDAGNVYEAYRKNYLPQVYDNTLEEVKTAMSKYMKDKGVDQALIDEYIKGIKDLPEELSSRLKVNPSFKQERFFPNYYTAMEYGLKPKYTEPAQLLAHYRSELERTLANKELVENLRESGKISTEPMLNWKSVELPFSPKGYFAEPDLANMLNGIFRDEENISFPKKIVKGLASFNRGVQNITLAGGIPKTSVNFFSLGQLIRNITAGDFKAANALVRSNSLKKTAEFFAKNSGTLRNMAEEGIDLGGRIGSYENLYKSFKNSNGAKAWFGHFWNKSFDEKTFASFMPQLYTQTFKDVETKAIKNGMSEIEARKLAGDTTKAFYGLMENTGRSKAAEDAIGTVFFAPKFREGLINSLVNTGKSVSTEFLNPAYAKNRKLLAGMLLSYAGYNALNKKLTGHYMWENPPGKEFEVMIPKDDGVVMFIPFMPSFLAMPRNLGSATIALGKLDLATATNKLSQNLSMGLNITGEVISNKDRFGNAIVEPTDTAHEKTNKLAAYVGLSVVHPYIKELLNFAQGKQPLDQTLTKMGEAPIRYSTMTKIEQAEYIEAMRKQAEQRKREEKKYRARYDEIMANPDLDEINKIVDQMPEEEYQVWNRIYRSEKIKESKKKSFDANVKFAKIQKLVDSGDVDAANGLIDDLTDDEYKILKEKINELAGK